MKKTVFFGLVICLFISCRKDPDFDQLSSNFVVVTNKSPEADFSAYKTFYISDTIAYFGGVGSDTIITGANAQALVNTVKTNMTQRGYQFVAKGNKPDLGINMGVVKNINVDVVYPGWWDGYPGWWDPWYWGWYYPYYYPYSVTYVVTTGTVFLNLTDLKNAVAKQQLTSIWSAEMGGAVGSDINGNLQRGINGINESFAQSPYLKTN